MHYFNEIYLPRVKVVKLCNLHINVNCFALNLAGDFKPFARFSL